MKKRTKIIIAIAIVVLVLILLVVGYYIIKKVRVYTFTIIEINERNIICGRVDKFSQNKEITYYSFYIKDPIIKDIKGNETDKSDLKVGNTIEVVDSVPEVVNSIAYIYEGHTIEHLNDVKRIKIIKQDKGEAEILENRNKIATKEAIVVKVNEDSLDVMGTENTTELFTVKFSEEGNIGFKQGQKIKVYYNGIINTKNQNVKTIDVVGKIEILAEDSNTKIPEDVLREFYSSFDNVKITVEDLTNTKISFNINDTNELKYNYSDAYRILKKNVEIIPPETNNNAGYSNTSATSITWEEPKKISEIESKNTKTFENTNNNNIITKTFDWSNLYGELGKGDYQFLLETENNITVKISFSIDENKVITNIETAFLRQ